MIHKVFQDTLKEVEENKEEKQVVLSSALTCLVPGKTQKLMRLELDRQGAK